MELRCLVFASLAALAAMTPLPAFAQADTGADTDARAMFDEGRRAYDEGRFEDATRAFRRAYLLSPRYQLLYNIGQSELRAGRDGRALEAFEAFLRQARPDEPHRSEVEERARILRGMGVEAESAPPEEEPVTRTQPEAEPAAVLPETPMSRSEGPGPGPWILVGTGAAALVAGAVLMGVGVSEASRVSGATDGARWADLAGSASNANVFWGVGIALAAVGLAASGVGLVWALTGSSSPSAHEGGAVTRLRLLPTGLALEGEF